MPTRNREEAGGFLSALDKNFASLPNIDSRSNLSGKRSDFLYPALLLSFLDFAVVVVVIIIVVSLRRRRQNKPSPTVCGISNNLVRKRERERRIGYDIGTTASGRKDVCNYYKGSLFPVEEIQRRNLVVMDTLRYPNPRP